MTVTSREIEEGEIRRPQPPAPPARQHGDLSFYAVGIVALLVGFCLWLVGARFTVMGAPRVIEILFGLFRLDVRISLPTGWPLLLLTVVVGAAISKVEFGCHPRRAFFSRSLFLGVVLFFIWGLANVSDVASTYVGVTTVQADSWPITRWVAQTSGVAGLYTLFLTYCPELFMIGGWRWVKTGRF